MSASSTTSSSSPSEAELAGERGYLVGVAYRLLGSVNDAEDVVQEALLRAHERDDLRSLRAFLTTVVTRLCLDELRSARRKREAYAGPWFPEPVLTEALDAPSAAQVEHKENVSMAFCCCWSSYRSWSAPCSCCAKSNRAYEGQTTVRQTMG